MSDKLLDDYYLRQISLDIKNQIYKDPWGGVVIKNEIDGELIKFKSKVHYKNVGKKLFLHLRLKIFRDQGQMFPVFCCNQCEIMEGVYNLRLNSRKDDIEQLLCVHARIAAFLVPNWQEIWNIEVPRFATIFQPKINEEINFHIFRDLSRDSTFLAGVLVDNSPHLIVTATNRQTAPFCSTCDSQTCPHYRAFRARQRDQNNPGSNFVSSMDNEEIVNNGDNSDQEENADGEEDEDLHIGGEENHTDDHNDITGEEEEDDNGRHYLDLPPKAEYQKKYGYNFSKILYPFDRSSDQQETWVKRSRNIYDFPDSFIPVLSEDNNCSHGYPFDPDDGNLVLETNSILVYHNIGEQVFNVKNYERKSTHTCKERMKYDGHPQFLWNLGGGRFVNYTLLTQYLHLWKCDGISIQAMFKSIKEMASSSGIPCTMSYLDFHRAITGFFVCLSFDEKIAFECPLHGSSPEWINTDGKCTGPASRRVKDIEELKHHRDDQQIWDQSTKFKDRVFLPDFKERSQVRDLINGDTSYEDFLMSEDITSQNALMVSDLVMYLSGEYQEEIPKPFCKFLTNITKGTSVRGLLQVSSELPLEYLKSYCEETVNLRDAAHIDKLRLVRSQLPAFWAILDSICVLERTTFLPHLVSRIVLRILEIRKNMLEGAEQRDESEYIRWEGGEHPTMCYPGLKLFRYPKKYRVNNKTDQDVCNKEFQKQSGFTAGIFTLGCACEYNTTLGFELMINKESPHNLFRVLTCRDVDMFKLKGVLMDHACLFDTFVMNRDARMLQHKKVLVDGLHWNAQKKNKKNEGRGKGGHLACSDSFNWNLYKPHTKEKVNSQGREQMNALVERCAASLRLMSYQHFMIFMKGEYLCLA